MSAKPAQPDAYAAKALKEWNVSGMTIAIIKDDKIIFSKSCGTPEISKPEKLNENTGFAIAFNSKAYTVSSLAILVNEKKLNWDDKATKYLPEF